MKYRQGKDSYTWHFCANCPDWPQSDYEEIADSGMPALGDLCEQCIDKKKNKDCTAL